MTSDRHLVTIDREAARVARGEASLVLVVLRHGAIQEHTLPRQGDVLIGRDDDSGVPIAHRSISRRHATLRVNSDEVTVSDLGSRNGTFVGGQRIGTEPRAVREGETIVFGEVACHLMVARRSEFRSDVRVSGEDFDRRVTYEGERALRYDGSVSVLSVMFDAGPDSTLEQGLRAVAGNIRDLDFYCVRRSEHVDVMLVETERDDAHEVAERIARAIEGIQHRARIGVATFPGDAPSPALLTAASTLAARSSDGPGVFHAHDAVRVLRFDDREVIIADPVMHRVFGLIERVASTGLSVLFSGETGVGKEVAAHALHALGPRKHHRIVEINCAALPENLLESELFGHERGAFSGATATKSGLFEEAHGGTIFLDEIGEMSPTLQAKLLRVLETKRIRRVGGLDDRKVDVRVVSATHRDLHRAVDSGEFRQDLLYRLEGMRIEIPPLRARRHEIAILAARFVAEACRGAGREPIAIAPAAMAVLESYAWPGNIRELRHALASAAVLAEGNEVTVADLPAAIRGDAGSPRRRATEPPLDDMPLDEAVRHYERKRIERALEQCGGNQTQAARLLGIPRKTLVSKLKALANRS
ncbi:MAG TPA: sigma 54-interacting transcriptional regulator [Xanthomonadales bacterium]|nr:sigma 54-interacting transcriptional regulator [Xanthomonadales bacterium]